LCHQNWVQDLVLNEAYFSKFTFMWLAMFLKYPVPVAWTFNCGLIYGQMLN
jgi:hypothetical protein